MAVLELDSNYFINVISLKVDFNVILVCCSKYSNSDTFSLDL
jgi:hypothetical protein